jgi:aryl-alcohol dehydrogenase-like predicted oxidoreductase
MILGLGDIGYKVAFGDACDLIGRFWELGGREFDTAHTYAHWVPGMLGSSERTLGAALRTLGIPLDEARVMTKGGHPHTGPLYPRPERYLAPDLLRQDLDESLERLGLDRVDTFLLHRDDPSVPIEEIASLLQDLRSAGLVRRAGVSNWPLQRVAELRACLEGELAWQSQCSLAAPNWQEGPDPTMRRFKAGDFVWASGSDVACSCYSSSANGFFATGGEGGAFDNAESRLRLNRARRLAEARAVTPSQIALAWVAAQPGDVSPVIGTTTISHLEDAMASSAVALSPEERDWLGMP